MPGGDRTGPVGRGPMTGRAAGFCAGFSDPGFSNPDSSRGFGRGMGRGFGRGFYRRGRSFLGRSYGEDPNYSQQPNVYPQPSKDEEKTYLQNMIKGLEEEMKRIKERLQDLSKDKKETSE